MKKSVNQTLEGDASERNALTRKLYRYISEASRRVDEGTARAKSIVDLFVPSLEVHRQKLRENCEKLIFADPLLYGKKAQELLWRKGYYEAVSAAKRIRINFKDQEQLVIAHIESGIGHYHHLISKTQLEIGIQFNFSIDYSQVDIDAKQSNKAYGSIEDLKEWAKSFIQNCLIYLGDLSRYKTEYEELWNVSLSFRYYTQAAIVDPTVGMPYNQLGTLHTGRNYHLDSVRYYIVCLACSSPFQGAEGNLVRIFEKNVKQLEGITKNPDIIDQQESVKTLICKFLSLAEYWYFQEKLPNFNELCTSTLYELKECLQFRPLVTLDQSTSHEEYLKYIQQNEVTPEYLNARLINKFVIIILLCMNKLHKENSSYLFPLKAFALALLSQMLHKLFNDLVDIGFDSNITAKIIHTYKEKMKNQKNTKESKLENGFHETQNENSDKLPSVIKDKTELEINNFVQNDLPVKEVIIENSRIVNTQMANGTSNLKDTAKSLKHKAKKSSILLKLRRRRRRIHSFDSSDKTASESSDNSDFYNDKLSEQSSSESDTGLDTCSPSTSDEEHEDNETKNDTKQEATGNKKDDNQSTENSIHNSENELSKNKDIVENEATIENNVKPEDAPNHVDSTENAELKPKEFNEQLFREFLEQDNILMPLHLLLNWLYGEVDLIISCGSSGRPMFQALVDVLNIVHGQIFPKLSWNNYSITNQFHPSLKYFHELYFSLKYNSFRKVPLEEDYDVKGLEILERGLKYLNWNCNRQADLSTSQANGSRLIKLIDFGTFLVKLNVGVIFNKRLKLYLLKKVSNKKSSPSYKKYGKSVREIHHTKSQRMSKQKSEEVSTNTSNNQSGGSLMKSLGRLWLSEQVRALESEVVQHRHPQPPAYAVLDADALCKHTHLVKQLVASKRVIVLIPTIVLQSMDELKKESGAARSAIRWMEGQLRNGSRFIRAQRPSETTPLPHIKYPKKMHRDVQIFIQIIQFCHFFLSNDTGESSLNSKKPNGSGDSKDDESSLGKTTMESGKLSKSDNPTSNLIVLLTGSNHSYVEQKDFSYTGVAQSAGVTMYTIQEFCSKWRHCFNKGGRKR